MNLAIALTTLVALLLRGYLLLRPGVLTVTQYDDGPYFGSAVRLVHGVLPYRDYAFVQPPGITVLMSPVALLTYLTGTAWGLGLARIVTVLAGATAVTLAGLLVRHRGTLAVLLAGGVLALYPPAVDSSHTVLLEPWLVLFSLIGAVTVFDGDRVTASTGRLIWGGVLFGFAGAIKTWAIVPVLVVTALCLPHLRRAVLFVAGVAAGFVIPVLPFAAVSPGLFYTDVVVAQLARIGHSVAVWDRLQSMIGIPGAPGWTNSMLLTACIALVAFVILAQAAAWLVTRQPMPPLDWFATLSAVLIVAIFLWPPYFASHYSAFLGPFLAIALALPVSRLVAGVQPGARARRRAGPDAGAAPASPPGRTRRLLARSGLILIGVAIIAGAVARAPTGRLSTIRRNSPAAVARVVPPDACVVTDQTSFLLLANRFTSNVPGCSQMVDGLGTDLALSGGRRPENGAGKVPAVLAAWHHAFSAAGYAVLTPNNRLRIPWTPQLRHYFDRNFLRVLHGYGFTLYKRTAPGANLTG